MALESILSLKPLEGREARSFLQKRLQFNTTKIYTFNLSHSFPENDLWSTTWVTALGKKEMIKPFGDYWTNYELTLIP